MKKLAFYFVLLLPLIALALLLVWGSPVSGGWPPEAQEYQAWYSHQPLVGLYRFFNLLGILGILILVFSTVGAFLNWAHVRFLYALAVILLLSGEISDFPILIGWWQSILDDVAKITIGAILGIMFFRRN